MKKTRVLVNFLFMLFLLTLPVTSFAYTYQSNEYGFSLVMPEKPAAVIVSSEEDGVRLDFSRGENTYPFWWVKTDAIEDAEDEFIDPTTLSKAELEEYYRGLREEDYGAAQCEKVGIIKAGKYNGTLVVTRENDEMTAIVMFKASKLDYTVTLTTDKKTFEQQFQIFKQSLTTFAEI